jgi:hypothetical protein
MRRQPHSFCCRKWFSGVTPGSTDTSKPGAQGNLFERMYDLPDPKAPNLP